MTGIEIVLLAALGAVLGWTLITGLVLTGIDAWPGFFTVWLDQSTAIRCPLDTPREVLP